MSNIKRISLKKIISSINKKENILKKPKTDDIEGMWKHYKKLGNPDSWYGLKEA